MSKPWGGLGAWAADAERAEAEEKEEQISFSPSRKIATATADTQSFPSLKDAVATKPKKKKAVPMSLSEFTTGQNIGPGTGGRRDYSSEPKGLTPDEMLRLPTGPKERSAEEMQQGRLGGGFRSYGRSSGPPGRDGGRGDDGDGSWGSGGGGGGGRRSYGDDERRGGNSRASDFDQPSRADEADNWASMKKPMSSMDSGRNNNRYSSLGGGGGGGGGSKADEDDNWASGKKTMALPARTSSFGSGFRDSPTDSDRWSRGGGGGFRDGDRTPSDSDRWGRGGGGGFGDRERPRIVLDPRGDGPVSEPARTNKPSPFGAARPREEILAEKGLDWKKLESDIETRKPTSSHSSRPSSAQSNRSESSIPQVLELTQKARPKVNPFGDAKPREILLQEQGKDWRKIDLELERRAVDRPETDEEKKLKEEIDHLKKEIEKEDAANANGEAQTDAGEPQTRELILSKERDLELLILELDDKIRFGQRPTDRPGSGAGRVGFSDRPLSQYNMGEESRNMEFADRPPSHGRGDAWIRSGDDRRGFQGSRERGFPGSRETDRSKTSGPRW